MEKGSPTSSAFSIPWLAVLIAWGLASLGFKLFSHRDPSLKSEGSANMPGGSGTFQSRTLQPDGSGDQMSRKEVIKFAQQTELEELSLVDVSIEDSVAILRVAIHQADPKGEVPSISLSEEWNVTGPTHRSADEVRLQNLRLGHVPLEIALKYVCDSTSTGWSYEDGKILLTPNINHWGTLKRCGCGAFLDQDGEHPRSEHGQFQSEADPFAVDRVEPNLGESGIPPPSPQTPETNVVDPKR